MMSGVSLETCWASYKHGIINFDILLHLVGYVKPEDASAILGLLMMSGLSLETCWASYKHGIINSDILLHLVGYVKPEVASAILGLLMISGVSLETCWASYVAGQRPATSAFNNLTRMKNQRLLVQFLGSWWWAVCRSKRVELHINME